MSRGEPNISSICTHMLTNFFNKSSEIHGFVWLESFSILKSNQTFYYVLTRFLVTEIFSIKLCIY